MLIAPLSNASSQLAMRAMKKLPDTVVSSYMQLSMAIIFTALVYIRNENFYFFSDFTANDWLIVVIGALVTIMS